GAGRSDLGRHPQSVQSGLGAAEAELVPAQRALDLESQCFAARRLLLANRTFGPIEMRRAKSKPPAPRATDDTPDRLPALADLRVEIAQVEAPEPLHRTIPQFVAQQQDLRTDGVLRIGCEWLVHACTKPDQRAPVPVLRLRGRRAS